MEKRCFGFYFLGVPIDYYDISSTSTSDDYEDEHEACLTSSSLFGDISACISHLFILFNSVIKYASKSY